jgi:hypothetical protein
VVAVGRVQLNSVKYRSMGTDNGLRRRRVGSEKEERIKHLTGKRLSRNLPPAHTKLTE